MYRNFKMKSVCFLTAVMIFTAVFPAFAATEMAEPAKIQNLLEALDITLGNKDITSDTPIKRAEAAALMLKFTNRENGRVNVQNSYYSDVDKNYSAAGVIMLASDYKLMYGYGDGTFRPENAISYSEAVISIVNALGYQQIMDGKETDAYFEKAYQLGFLSGISGISRDDSVTYGVMQTLLYNALGAKAAVLKVGVKQEWTFETTALEEYFDVLRGSGVLTSAQITALAGFEPSSEGSVVIGGISYLANNDNLKEYLGQDIRFYYRDYKSEKTVLYVYDSKSASESFSADDIESYDGAVYRVERAGKTKSYKLSADADVIYNGKLRVDYIDDTIFVPQNGDIKLVDTQNDGRYDVVFITSYSPIIVSKVDIENTTIYDKCSKRTIDWEDGVRYFTVTDENGYFKPVSSIEENNVVFVAQSMDKEVMSVKVSQQTVSGEITKTGSNDKYAFVVIDGTEYEISDIFYKTEDAELNLGENITAVLDPEGRIAVKVTSVAGTKQICYLLSAYLDDIEENVFIKVLTKEDEIKRFMLGGAVKIDGVKAGRTPQQILNALKKDIIDNDNFTIKRDLVAVEFNENEHVIKMDFPYRDEPLNGESENSLHRFANYIDDPVGLQYKSGPCTLSGRILTNSSTIVFVVPKNPDAASEDDFKAEKFACKNDDWLSVDAYSLTYPETYADVLITHDSLGSTMKNWGAESLITKIETELDEEDMARTKVYMKNGKTENSYFVEEESMLNSWKAGIGDVVRSGLNSKGELCDMVVYYDYSENKVEGNNYAVRGATNEFTGEVAAICGGIYNSFDGISKIFPGDVLPAKNTSFYMFPMNSFNSVIFHKKTDKTEDLSDISQINTYCQAESNYTKIVFTFSYGSPRNAYIYLD